MLVFKKIRILFVAILLAFSVLYAQETLGPGIGECKGCGDFVMCWEGGNYTGSGWSDCWIDPFTLECHASGTYGQCTYVSGAPDHT